MEPTNKLANARVRPSPVQAGGDNRMRRTLFAVRPPPARLSFVRAKRGATQTSARAFALLSRSVRTSSLFSVTAYRRCMYFKLGTPATALTMAATNFRVANVLGQAGRGVNGTQPTTVSIALVRK
uniref:Uncharacterized protein n=1 Tax=Trichuris muris TaxID=70415 RepID=A0A5S6R4A9_TRIMR